MTNKLLVFSTTASDAEAGKIARALVERRLAACVNILPKIKSVYRWQGKIEENDEWLLVIKTTQPNFTQVRDVIKELHSYEVPECVSVRVEDGSPEYLRWIDESV